jgi:hypothetical protein
VRVSGVCHRIQVSTRRVDGAEHAEVKTVDEIVDGRRWTVRAEVERREGCGVDVRR